MKYMLLIYGAEDAYDDDSRNACYVESTSLAHELKERGTLLATSPLHSVATATSVRVRDGKRLITDGPFAETREQLGGYYLIDAADLDEAIGIAERIPGAKVGTVEVRPVVELPGLRT
ncbi:MAG TPA: YciI family protein [Thermomicrobiales bacterium]|nr:YciI family protein [Thermomicrobiales bacterium]